MLPINDYLCVFYAGQNPAECSPVAMFDRLQFLMDFINGLRGEVEFREDDRANDILTVRQWRALAGLPLFEAKG